MSRLELDPFKYGVRFKSCERKKIWLGGEMMCCMLYFIRKHFNLNYLHHWLFRSLFLFISRILVFLSNLLRLRCFHVAWAIFTWSLVLNKAFFLVHTGLSRSDLAVRALFGRKKEHFGRGSNWHRHANSLTWRSSYCHIWHECAIHWHGHAN